MTNINNYEAVKGIKKDGLSSRPDIEEIINMPDCKFNLWHHARRKAINELISKYSLIGDMPYLHIAQERKLGEINNYIREEINELTYVLNDLEAIKILREEYKKPNQNQP